MSFINNFIHRLTRKIRKKINNVLIRFFVRRNFINLLCYLFISNFKKIKQIDPPKKIKHKVIVLAKSGGLDDLICSQRKYNKNIMYVNGSRSFIKQIFYSIFKINNEEGIKDLSNKETKRLTEKYKNFLILFLKQLKKKFKFNAFIGFNFEYFAEIDLHRACSELKIPFIILYKESVTSELDKNYRVHVLRKKKVKFEGYKMALYSNFAKKYLTDSNFVNKNQVDVVGCPRLIDSFHLKEIKPKDQILYYAIENDRGLPNRNVKLYGNKFFKDLKDHKNFNSKYNWNYLHINTIKILKQFALKYPKSSIIIKIKTGESPNTKQYLNLPKNIKVQYYGTGHKLLKDSKVIIAWNTTAILEAIAANRFILLPYFHKKNYILKKKDEMVLNLKDGNYGYSKNDFYKKLDLFMNKKYNKNNVYNNQYSLKYHLGNADKKADFRLNKFIRKNIIFKIKNN